MTSIYRHAGAALILSFVAIAVTFCASKNFIKVNYQLPLQPVELEETRVALTVKDMRENPAIVTQSAKKALKNFTGHFALIVAKEKNDEKLVGAFGLSSMIREIFRHRLENAGVQVVAEEDIEEFMVEIVLNKFSLDLQNRKWIITMNYQANLIKQNQVVAGEMITGSAERLRVISGKNAELVIGELVSDVVNRLNLSDFLKAAGA